MIPVPRRRLAVLAAACASALSPSAAHAAPGEVDTTFGTAGIVTTALGGPAFGAGSALDTQDRVVVAGTEQGYGLAVFRHLAGGGLDPTFDGDGIATTPFAGFSSVQGVDVVLDGARRPVVVASAYDTGSFTPVSIVARYTADGTLDGTFGSGGRVVVPSVALPSGIGLQPDGRIVIAGASGYGAGSAFVAARLAADDGTVDAAYGAAATITPAGSDIYANEALVDASGRAVIAGTISPAGGGTQRYAVARFSPGGAPDGGFGGGDGLAEASFGGGDASTNTIAVMPDGRIVVAGDANAHTTLGLARFTDAGALDTTFDGDGLVTTTISGATFASGTAVHVAADGRIDLAARRFDGTRLAFVLARYTGAGLLDGTPTITDTLDGHASSIVAQSTGRLVTAGTSTPSGAQSRATLVAYEGTPSSSGGGGGGGGGGSTGGGSEPPSGFVPAPPSRYVAPTPAGPEVRWRVQGIEVSQGSQQLGVPDFDQAAGRYSTNYRGVKLVRGGRTVARVFVDSKVPVRVTLTGYSGVTKLGTLDPRPTFIPADTSSLALGVKQQWVFGGFQFELPRDWARRTLRLEASVTPAAAKDACKAAACGKVSLQNIQFTPVRPVKLRLVALTDGGVYPPAPAEALERTLGLVPQGDSPIVVPSTYAGALEIGDLKVGTTVCTLYFWCKFRTRDDTNPATLERLQDWDEDNPPKNSADVDITIGVAASSDIGISNGASVFPFLGLRQACSVGGWDKVFTCQRPVIAVSELVNPALSSGRPLTNAGHELFHALGRPHAGSACKSGSLLLQQSETWPPDETGRLNGVGLDLARPVYGAGAFGIPFVPREFGSYLSVVPAKLAANYSASVGQTDYTYDLMSYCGSAAGGGDPNSWISPYNWDKVVDKLSTGKAGTRAADPAALRAVEELGTGSPIAPRVEIDAIQTPSGMAVTTLEEVRSRTPKVASPDDVPHAVFRDAAGRTVSDTPMQVRSIHGDAAGGAVPVTMYRAIAPPPPAGVTSLALVDDGKVVDERKRSAHPPTVAAVAVPKAPLGRTARFTLRWRSGDRDGDRRQVTVQFAADGRRFGTIFTGEDKGAASLLFSALKPGPKARFRVLVTDGFDSAAALSPPVRVPAPRPQIVVAGAPRPLKAAPGTVLLLSAQATDAGGVPLAPARIRWTVGKKRRAPGTDVTAVMPKKGNLVLVVAARGATGVVGTRRIVVRPGKKAVVRPPARLPAASAAVPVPPAPGR